MGLGSLDAVRLAEARERAAECRKLRERGKDPIEERDAQRAVVAAENAKLMTFDQCAAGYIAAHRAGWRNTKHASQWENTLATYVSPVFGKVTVRSVDVGLVIKALEPIWSAKPETASRVRGRIEAVLDWAAARGFRDADNPARWKGRLDKLLPRPSKVRAVEHHAALQYDEIGSFMLELRKREGRMKGGRAHRIPLSEAALAVLKRMANGREGDHVFPGDRRAMLSNMALLMLLRRMGRGDLTAHGFRSTFRDWAAERTNFPNEVVEMALAHAVGNKVEAAYRRSDLFEKRRELMDAWAAYCENSTTPLGEVVALHSVG